MDSQYNYFPHRAAAAFFALAALCFLVNDFARAFPPFNPPLRPSATAFGSFPASGSDVFGAVPVASATIRAAIWLRSGFVFGFVADFFGDFAIPQH